MSISNSSSAEVCRHLIENIHTAVLVFDGELRLVYANPAAEMLFTVSSNKICGVPARELLPSDNELMEVIERALLTGQAFTEHELSVSMLGPKTITVDCTITPLGDAQSARAVLVELLQVDRHLRISREENLMAQNLATRELVRGVAHEIKNPLGGLRGAAQLLERQLDDESLREYTRIIIGEADRLQTLVDGMLGPRGVPKRSDTNIHEVLERVRSLMLAEVREGIAIVRDYDPSIPTFLADRDLLVQAILNIVRNAIQAMEQRGTITLRTRIERQFTIANRRHKLVARIEIIDTGPGIPDDMLPHIFYPMVTGHAEGTGLGLSIAQSLINRHGGLIACDSHPGKTTFTLLLPLSMEET